MTVLDDLDADRLNPELVGDLVSAVDLGVFIEHRVGYTNAPFHTEWARLVLRHSRLAICAPRGHGKSESLTVCHTVWRSIYQPGHWTAIFTATAELGVEILDRITTLMAGLEPGLMHDAHKDNALAVTFANGSRVDVAGARTSVRGIHPDLIIGDDVLDETATLTAYQRRKMERWWGGTVGGMAHTGVTRMTGRSGKLVAMPPTRIVLVGTPFHRDDLLLGMRDNPVYRFFRYDTEVSEARRVSDPASPGERLWAVEAA